MMIPIIKSFKPIFVLFFLVSLLNGCGLPNEQQVSQDFKMLFEKEVGKEIRPNIISVGSGEGDSDNVYKHIKFDLIVEQDVNVQKGWLANMSFKSGQRLSDGEVVVLYQKSKDSPWKMTWYELRKMPK